MKHYGSPESREEFLDFFYMGDVPEEIAAEDEADFPEKFQLVTLSETPMLTDKVQ